MVQLLDDEDSEKPCYKVLDLPTNKSQGKAFQKILFDGGVKRSLRCKV